MKQDFQKWFADKGDETLRIDYPLNENSIVLDVGGYKGDWAAKINEKYNCKVIVFEPVMSYYVQLLKRFQNNDKIMVLKFALGSENSQETIKVNNDASSLYTKTGQDEVIRVSDVSEVFDFMKFDKIDLMKVNIEGSEYPLLERMIETNLHQRVTDVQVQFHTFIPDFEQRYANIKKELLKTHHLTYNYPFIWENWRKNV